MLSTNWQSPDSVYGSVAFRHKKPGFFNSLRKYFSKPINSIPSAALVIGVVLLYASFGFHPVVTQAISNNFNLDRR